MTSIALSVENTNRQMTEEARGQVEDESERLSDVRNHDLFFPVGTERRSRVLGTDEVIQAKLVVGIHENGIDPQPRLTGPPDSRQSHREGFGLSWNM